MRKRDQIDDSKFFWRLVDRTLSWRIDDELGAYLRWQFRDNLDDNLYYHLYRHISDFLRQEELK
jgi:hypothetical protein